MAAAKCSDGKFYGDKPFTSKHDSEDESFNEKQKPSKISPHRERNSCATSITNKTINSQEHIHGNHLYPQYLHPPSLSSIQHLFPPKSVYPEKTRNLESNQPIDPIHSQCASPSTKSKTLKIKPSNFLPYKGLLLHQDLSFQYQYPPGDPKTLNRTRKGRV